MKRVGIFGGSFNPPHVAHVLAVHYALLVGPIDELMVVPVFRHPFSKELASYEDRLAMCELAFAGLARVSVSTVERELGGESLTLRTLERLRATHPAWSFRLIIGSDVVPDLPKWHRFDRIAQLAPPFVLERKGATDHVDRALLPEISSTAVRELFARGAYEEVGALVPRDIVDYVRKRSLFGASPE